MLPKYDLSKLEGAIYDFYLATGVSITLFDKNRKPITKSGLGTTEYCSLIKCTKEGVRACKKSNDELFDKCEKSKAFEMHICKAGLLDAIIPILNLGELIGFLMIGQIRNYEQLPENLSNFPMHLDKITEYYEKMPIYDAQRVKSVINIGEMLTKYILFENILKPQQKPTAELISEYIKKNLHERLTVDNVAKATHISVSGIYKCMKSTFGCTLGEYITKLRIERAIPLLEDGELSMEKVAESVGFSDPAYFSRCFKKLRGISPLKYRKGCI